MSELNHALRKQGITGSEIAQVAGVSRYGSALEVWSRKLGLIPPLEVNPDMARGRYLEPALCDWACEEMGLIGCDVGTLQSMENPLIIASPDRLLYTDATMAYLTGVLEVKSPRYTTSYWTHPDDDPFGVDAQYIPQVTWEMAAAGVERAVVGALCYGELWLYQLELDPELLGLLTQCAEKFWRDHIVAQVPPEPTAASDQEVLRRLYPREREPLVQIETGGDLDLYVTEWRRFEEYAKDAKSQADRSKASVMSALGEHEGAQTDDWRVTWRQNKPSKKTDWERVARAAGASDELIAEHTREVEGPRVLRYSDLTKKTKKARKGK